MPPDGGLITRFPSNQTWRRNYSGLATASNVRAAAGRLFNAPGYEPIFFFPHLTTAPLLIFDAELTQGMFHVLGDCGNLYAVSPAYRPAVYAGIGGVVAGYNFTFEDARATGYLDQTLGVVWTLISGPGTAFFSDPGAINATVTVSDPGLYTFQVSGSDGLLTLTSTTTVRFITCTASPDYTFPTPEVGGALALTGEIFGESDPTNPKSDGSSYTWSQVSGPDTVVFVDPVTVLSPNVTVPNTPGSYVLALTVSVGTTSYASDITLIVQDAAPPITRGITFTEIADTGAQFSAGYSISIDGAVYIPLVFGFQYEYISAFKVRMIITDADTINGSHSVGATFELLTAENVTFGSTFTGNCQHGDIEGFVVGGDPGLAYIANGTTVPFSVFDPGSSAFLGSVGGPKTIGFNTTGNDQFTDVVFEATVDY